MNCPICGQGSRVYCEKQAVGQTWVVRQCLTCGHGYVGNPPPLERLAEIQEGREAHVEGAGSGESSLAPPVADHLNLSFARDIARRTSGRGRTLDVGCGNGSLTLALHEVGFRPHLLIDFDPRAAGAAAHIPDSEFRQSAFEDVPTDEPPFDVIVMSHVLEHARDPMSWLRHAATLLSPQGVLGVSLPNFGGVYRLLGARDPFLIPPVHLQFFTPRSLRTALERATLTVGLMASSSWVTTSPVNHRLSFLGQAVRRMWNVMRIGLDQTTRGIVLVVYANKSPG